MRDFQNGIIYALTHDGRPFYVGSTTQTLDERLSDHVGTYRSKAARYPNRKIFRRFNEVGIENVRIELLMPCACDSYDALLAEERRHILAQGTHVDGCNQRVAGGRPGGEHLRYRAQRLQNCKDYHRALLEARRVAALPA